MLRTARHRTARALRLLAVCACVAGLVATACSNGDDDDATTTTTTEATRVTVDTEDEGPPAASIAASAMDLMREEPRFSSFLSAVEGTRYEEQLECADEEEAPTRGWTIVLAPVDSAFEELADTGPEFDADNGFGEANEAFTAAAGVTDGTEVTFDVDRGMGSMTWTVEPGAGDEGDDEPGTPNGTQYVIFAVDDGRAVLPTDTDTPDLPSVATCGAASTLQFLVLGATLAEPDARSADFPEIVPDDE